MDNSADQNLFREYSDKNVRGGVIKKSPLNVWLDKANEPISLLTGKAKIIKTDRKTKTGLVQITEESDIFVKEYKLLPQFRILKLIFGQSRALNVWNIAWHLYNNNVPVAKPIAYFIYHNGDYNGTGYYCCETLTHCTMLADIACYNKKLYDNLLKSDFFERVLNNISVIHQLGISHGDLKWTNILVNENTFDFWFVDLDASIMHRNISQDYLAGRDISRFVINAVETDTGIREIEKFLDIYSDINNLSLDKLKQIIRPKALRLLRRKKLTCDLF